MPWPNPALLDDFTRADESPLGGNWTSPAFSLGNVDLYSNTARLAVAAPCAARWNPHLFGPECAASYSIAAWTTTPGNTSQYTLYLCANASGTNSYEVEYTIVYDGTPYVLTVRRNGSWVQSVASGSTAMQAVGFPATASAGDELGLYVNGRSIEVWYQHGGSWALMVAEDDAALSGTSALPAGYVAIGGNETGSVVPPLQTRLDNFRARNTALFGVGIAGLVGSGVRFRAQGHVYGQVI